ncbi:MAG: rhodanese-like domain-containing protein [Actinomycetota bacterium]|nr:rhodanese-like domain-containing protein [Actinomycetota bacterium]
MPPFPPLAPTVAAAAVPERAVLLDVREDDEWAAGHAPEALHVPLSELPGRVGELPRDRDVAVICRVGSRSAMAAAFLVQAGWPAVNVADGMFGWQAADRPMVSESGRPPIVL